MNNGYAAPLAFADCTEPWGWESSPPASQPPRVPATLGTVAPLAFELLDVEYAPAIERFVGVSVSPPALRVFAPSGAVELNVMLGAAPTALSVALDGSRAAVGTPARWCSSTSRPATTRCSPGLVRMPTVE